MGHVEGAAWQFHCADRQCSWSGRSVCPWGACRHSHVCTWSELSGNGSFSPPPPPFYPPCNLKRQTRLRESGVGGGPKAKLQGVPPFSKVILYFNGGSLWMGSPLPLCCDFPSKCPPPPMITPHHIFFMYMVGVGGFLHWYNSMQFCADAHICSPCCCRCHFSPVFCQFCFSLFLGQLHLFTEGR